jgi:hypothetical protein
MTRDGGRLMMNMSEGWPWGIGSLIAQMTKIAMIKKPISEHNYTAHSKTKHESGLDLLP